MNKIGQIDIISIFRNIIIICGIIFLIIFVASNQQSSKVLKDICKKCGYNKLTDQQNLLPYSMFPVAHQIECDNKNIITLDYPKKESKWNDELQYDWNKPINRNC